MTAAQSRVVTVGEHIEIEVGDDIAMSPRYNEDIAPTKAAQRTWSRRNVGSYDAERRAQHDGTGNAVSGAGIGIER